MQPLMTIGAAADSYRSRISSISAMALRFSRSSSASEYPSSAAQRGLARQVGLSSTKPAPRSLASSA